MCPGGSLHPLILQQEDCEYPEPVDIGYMCPNSATGTLLEEAASGPELAASIKLPVMSGHVNLGCICLAWTLPINAAAAPVTSPLKPCQMAPLHTYVCVCHACVLSHMGRVRSLLLYGL